MNILSADIYTRQQATLAVSGTAAQTATTLPPGVVDVWCNEADVFIKMGEIANDVTINTGYLIKQGNVVAIAVPTGALKLGAITAGASGTLRYHPVGL